MMRNSIFLPASITLQDGAEKITLLLKVKQSSNMYQLSCQEKLALMVPSQENLTTFQGGLFLFLEPTPITKRKYIIFSNWEFFHVITSVNA